MVSLRHATAATARDSGDGKISANAWNGEHALTGDPNKLLGFDENGLGTEYDPAVLAADSAVGDRTALASASTTIGNRYLKESGREGVFVWDGSDLSDEVSADTAQGIFVAPASDTSGNSGAWRRVYDGPVKPAWWGVVYGDTTTGINAAANDAAISAMFDALFAIRITGSTPFLPDIDLGFGTIEISTAIAPPGVCNIQGRGSGNWSGAAPRAGSCIKAYGCTGIQLDYINSQVQDVLVQGDYTDALGEAEYHGIAFTQRVTLTRCKVHQMRGDGFNADGGTNHLPDNTILIQCDARNCRNGTSFGVTGGNADANVITVMGGVFNTNREWAHKDYGRLGNVYIGTESNSNAQTSFNDGVSGGAALVVYSGKTYYAVHGQETWCSTNSPSGDTTDNQGWIYKDDGGGTAGTGKPAWFSGILVRAGGMALTTSAVAPHVFYGCYTESNQGRVQASSPTIIDGGVMANYVWLGNGAIVRRAGGTVSGACLEVQPSIKASGGYTGTGGYNTSLGEYSSSQRTFIRFQGSGFSSFGRAIKALDSTTGDMVLDDAHTVPYVWYITGTNTAQQHGTGAAMPHAFRPYKLIIPEDGNNNTDNGRRQAYGTAAPTTGAHARGEIYWNKSAAVGSPIGWMCTAAGTPGTWSAMANL